LLFRLSIASGWCCDHSHHNVMLTLLASPNPTFARASHVVDAFISSKCSIFSPLTPSPARPHSRPFARQSSLVEMLGAYRVGCLRELISVYELKRLPSRVQRASASLQNGGGPRSRCQGWHCCVKIGWGASATVAGSCRFNDGLKGDIPITALSSELTRGS
jgi:hypothetical protein